MVLITPAYTDLYSSLEDIPRFNFSTEQIINQAPRTNVGIVSLPTGEYTNPRSDIARSLLNYGPNAKDTSGPAGMGSAPSLIRDSDGNVIRNTELNPFNPSSQFFPYEPDYAGIMSTKAYLEDKGFQVTSTVTKDCYALIAGDDKSSKFKKASTLQVSIIDYWSSKKAVLAGDF